MTGIHSKRVVSTRILISTTFITLATTFADSSGRTEVPNGTGSFTNVAIEIATFITGFSPRVTKVVYVLHSISSPIRRESFTVTYGNETSRELDNEDRI